MQKRLLIYFLFFTLALLPVQLLFSQASVSFDSVKAEIKAMIDRLPADAQVQVTGISIRGNKITKDYIILREIEFKKGNYVPAAQLFDAIVKARQDVVNTQLFLEIIPVIKKLTEHELDIEFVVKERWYIFPVPYFKLIDRNLNQWIVEQNASLERVNYGLKFDWYNVSGRRDKLEFRYVNGYNRQYALSYNQPFADKKLEKGFLVGVYYTSTRQTSFATDSNKQVFFPVENNQINDFVRTSFRIETGFSYRKGINHRHTLRLNYVREQLADTITRIIEQNQNKGYLPYFTDNKRQQSFGEFSYSYQYFNLDNIAYPTKGLAFNGSFTQRGLGAPGMNLWQLSGKVGKYMPISKKTFLAFYSLGTVKVPFKQPMYNMPAIGYGDFYLQGLEYYVIDGVLAGMLRTTVAQELFKVNVPTFIIKNEKYKKIPFRVIGKVYSNIGGAYTPYYTPGLLNNRLLYTYGFGLDIISYYDFTARFDYSFNQLCEKGLFLHVRKDF
jgi:Surface antigen variable number repeat